MKLSKRAFSKDISRAQNQFYLGAVMNDINYMMDALEEGANIHSEEEKALELAAEEGNFKAVKFLLENGANPMARNFAAYNAAKKNGHIFVAEFIKEKTPIGTEEYEQSFEIPEIVQRKDLYKKERGYRQPIKSPEYPEELVLTPEKKLIADLKQYLINKFGKKFIVAIMRKKDIPEGFYQSEYDPNTLTSDFGWKVIPTHGGFKVFNNKEFVKKIKSLDEIPLLIDEVNYR